MSSFVQKLLRVLQELLKSLFFGFHIIICVFLAPQPVAKSLTVILPMHTHCLWIYRDNSRGYYFGLINYHDGTYVFFKIM